MLWLLLSLLTGYALLLPVTITVSILYHGSLHAKVTAALFCFHKTWTFSGFPGAHVLFGNGHSTQFFSLLHQQQRARRFLLQHTTLLSLDAALSLHTGDAARTALLTGLLRALASPFQQQHVHICLQPVFIHAPSSIQVRCIIRWKLGTLILTAGMLLFAAMHSRHLRESEAI